MRETERQKRKIYENDDEDAPAVRLIATLSLVNVASPRLIAAELLVKGLGFRVPYSFLKFGGKRQITEIHLVGCLKKTIFA